MAETLFSDGKEEGALRTIGEVAAALCIKPHVLRYWERQFPMLQPLKRSGGRRYYRVEDVAMLRRIDRLVNHEGYTLNGAQVALQSAQPAVQSPRENGDAGVDLVGRLASIRDRLARALAD